MIIFLLLFICTVSRYQFLSEQEVIDVITVSKEEALSRISFEDGPSYLLTRNRKRYNCTSTYQKSVVASSQDSLLVVSNNLLKDYVFEGRGEYGTISIYPTSHVVIDSLDGKHLYFELDRHTKHVRFGENNISKAKLTEFFVNPSIVASKVKVMYLCNASILSYDRSQWNSLGYSLSQIEAGEDSWYFTVSSDLFCLTEEENSGYDEIWKRLSEKTSAKTTFVCPSSLSHIDERWMEVHHLQQSQYHADIPHLEHCVQYRCVQ